MPAQSPAAESAPSPAAAVSNGGVERAVRLAMCEQKIRLISELPAKGNSMAMLCKEMRAVLDGHTRDLADERSSPMDGGGIYRSALNLHTKIDTNKSTLGLILLDDSVGVIDDSFIVPK